VVLTVLLVAYDGIRQLAPIRVGDAVQHALDVLHLEGPLAWERVLNRWFAAHRALDVVAVGYYQFMHIGVALGVLAWCYVWRPDVYRPARNSLVLINAVGLVVFAAYPVAPPRLLPGSGYVDLVAHAGFGASHGPVPMNAYAAMPSLHIAWAIGVAMVGLALSDRTAVRGLFIAHPVLTAVAVVGTANHYLFDIGAGAALGASAALVVGLRGSHRPLAARTATAGGDRFTLVAFHAHPDDETLFTGGTLARAAAEGHRVVVVVATLGDAGLADPTVSELGDRRLSELAAAAIELGVHRWEWLGYTDSGRYGDTTGDRVFTRVDPEQAAERLAAILRQERADVLTTYDSVGGYGHPDHVRVHEVGARAASLAGTPVVLEATVDRRAAQWAAALLRVVPRLPNELRPAGVRRAFVHGDRVTHRVDVAPFADRKRAAMRAHASQRSGGSGVRSLALYLRIPRPIFRKVFGTEWFVEPGRTPVRPPLDDVFATVRRDPGVAARNAQMPVPAGRPEEVWA
jgi:LmbE family N-acetylglucosaminyl deacetylase